MTDTVTTTAGTTDALDQFRPPVQAVEASELDKDTFLKLLVAQLKYQDPMNPASSEDFIATTAQFTTVEKLDELTKQGENTALITSLTTAGSLIGRTITANVGGVDVHATVLQSRITSGEVMLETDQGTVRLGQIVAVGPPTPGATEPTTSASPEPLDRETTDDPATSETQEVDQ